MTEEQFKLLIQAGGWTVDEVPRDQWKHLPDWMRGESVLAIFASGCMNQPKVLNGMNSIGGLDFLRHETKPKKDEPEGNAYHYVMVKTDEGVKLYGPFRSETFVPHWFEAEDLDKYWLNI